MINQVPGCLGKKLTTRFELVHGCKPDSKTWFELFSVGYFNHPKDGAQARSNVEDQSLDGIAVGRDDKSNTIIFYNPITKSYYHPQAFRLDESRLPATNFPASIRYDGGLTCGLFRNRNDPVPEHFPPGTHVNVKRGTDTVQGTIQRVPIPSSLLVSTAASNNDDTSPSSYLAMDHKGAFHKGYLGHTPEGEFCFKVRRNLRSLKVDWLVPLPDFPVQ
ncbi:hypothetical protein ACHAWF_010477 [Thalassiosira exigua]